MRSTLVRSRAILGLACLTLFLCAAPQTLWASVCHDGNWDDGEFCGRDAWLVTGDTEMNHDCEVDILDLSLFAREYMNSGPNLSADIDGDGLVSPVDLLRFRGSWGNSASPCTPSGMLPNGCQGKIALSFSSNPATIVSTLSQSPGSGTVHVIIDGWTSAAILEYGVETSSNISITAHNASYPYDGLSPQVWCDPDAQHTWHGFFDHGGNWPSGPVAFSYLDYTLSDANPAWIKLVPMTSCYSKARIRWGQFAADRSFDFSTVLNAGINAPAPAGQSTCGPLSLPVLAPHMIWLLAAVLLAPGALLLARRSFGR